MASSRYEIISEKLVKPSTPTPISLRNFKLSLIDQRLTERYTPMALFFPNQHDNQLDDQISSLLETSLSKTLSFYYPFAGRLIDNNSINCNDMGVTFLETRIKCSMSEILKEVDHTDAQNIVFPNGLSWSSRDDHRHSLVVAQLSHFDCGGKAISLCMSHRVGDGHTICNFINNWAAMTRQTSENPSPQFIGQSIFPPDDLSTGPLLDCKSGTNCITTRRYIFDFDKLSQLKAKASIESGVHDSTRFEVVSALLLKCAMSASMVCSGLFKPSVFSSALNIRPLIGPPVSQNYAGNLVSIFTISTNHEEEINFSRLVSEIRKAKVQHHEKYKAMTTTGLRLAFFEMFEEFKEMRNKNNDIDEYDCTSFCRFPTYDIDFGWGRPVKVSYGLPPYENFFMLTDNRSLNGIEALINLPEQVMSIFQSDQELLKFAYVDSNF